MYKQKYSPQEALERVKLMMKYDSSKTLNENKTIIYEQVSPSQLSKITDKIHYLMSGDVESQDLDELLSLLNSEVFGKKSSDGICAMKKVMDYYKKAGFFGTPGGGLLGTGNLLKDITKSIEIGEPEFDDVKKDLLNKINNELNSFCSGSGGGDRKSDGNIVVTPRGSSYKDCSGTYKLYCKSPKIGEVQACLGGLKVDNAFGPMTASKLKEKGFGESFTDADVAKICSKSKPDKPEIGGEIQQISVEDL
jgi:hypothetical protein